ncbi:PepSY-associated TM helix domain-containing protein [Zhouia amylolytica]|uniref:PepSY-associated TM helix domain-containing protein n=1 Tax=Zhouia amylolytica TaxID=376730 RepID=UPI0020CB8426|nr:PepSY-associated TM helix domain-containing protein [Zhouia amylolytica]MCQ0112261.1 PepSY domain-containing protein [Zhouia amylolytica]
MDKRLYNIFFHTHTISGIFISAVLYVIFFTGSFSFFRDEIINWERNESVDEDFVASIDFDKALDTLKNTYDLYNRDITINWPHAERRINFNLTGSKDSLSSASDRTPSFFYFDPETSQQTTYVESYSLGEFLYRLHFLAQIPYPYGYYLSGFVAFFFLFAIITGVLVHWKKIIPNFYLFRPKAKLKALFTDAHTALGVIGLPFQFIYAVTGAFFMIKLLLVAPGLITLYDNDQEKLYQELGFAPTPHDPHHKRLDKDFRINEYVLDAQNTWENFRVTKIFLNNYGDTNMHIIIEGVTDYRAKMNGAGKLVYNVSQQKVVAQKNPYIESTYIDAVRNLMYRLHFGDYGGMGLKVISFVLGLIGCFVIISGILIWQIARDKKHLEPRKRVFNNILFHAYMAVCMSIYPVTAFTFITVKMNGNASQGFIYKCFFLSWLALSFFYYLKRDYKFMCRNSLLLGSVFGFTIPIVNGIVTGNWFWITFRKGFLDIMFIDVFWLITSILVFLVWIKMSLKINSMSEIKI